ncbi:hypothetical protein [uncultured Ilyobacter sp.]|uniref:hypothetical protein n=1 Tax=uncultured Ilyobacter sp. TaxID=544433 RepID=UPI0029C0A5F2|nr:hypothetical protein [uncultured Ilyobacter sp.]
MKKLFAFIFLIVFSKVFSLDYFGEVEGTQRFNSYNSSYGSIELILGAEHQEDNFYSQVSLKATDDPEEYLELYRGYLEIYGDSTTFGVGRQMIVWGSAYIFNGADVFNEVDLENPRSDKDGLDLLRLKYNLENMSRLEGVVFKNSARDDNIGTRYTFLVDNYEFMANYFHYDKKNILGEVNKNEDVVLEVKGDAGIGIWSQLIHKESDDFDQNALVLGGDYSFDLSGNLLYTLAEGIYIKEEDMGALYLRYNYVVSEDIEVFQSLLVDGKISYLYVRSGLTYKLNDYFNIQVSYNYYNNFRGLYQYSSGEELDSELVFEIQGFF